mmetsp:Transcript_68524/g.115192  ORF Transcript_68524/g.115192 Transcript_68524/m.115192 type:complete len:87 (+) Transcript_68524:204-464(+)
MQQGFATASPDSVQLHARPAVSPGRIGIPTREFGSGLPPKGSGTQSSAAAPSQSLDPPAKAKTGTFFVCNGVGIAETSRWLAGAEG